MKFHIIGKGFIYPRHSEAIKLVGVEVDNYNQADYVVISTPSYLHYSQIMEALEKSKKVICEKPLVLSSAECEKLLPYQDKIFPIMQMRYLPLDISKRGWNDIEIDIQVHRSNDYLSSWKGQEDKSGGILFNFGIHYIDLIIHNFGYPVSWFKDKEGNYLRGEDYICKYNFSYEAPINQQKRVFRINKIEYNLETKENLHIKAYRDIVQGRTISLSEICRLIKLLENLKKF